LLSPVAIDRGFPRAKAQLQKQGYEKMMKPDDYFAMMSIMKYGSLVFALVFAGKIAAYIATHM
jgi:hypothetical protein